MTRILIATQPRDYHAFVIAAGLRHKGHDPVLWYGADFPIKQCGSIEVDGDGYRWSMRGEQLDEPAAPFDVVWLRRPNAPQVPKDLDPSDRVVAQRHCTAFYRAFWNLVAPDAFWVNSRFSRNADIKPRQLVEAREVGFTVPITLFSNDPERIKAFLRQHEGETIYKSFAQAHWQTDQGTASLFTTTIGLDDLPDDDILQASAGIFQRRVPRAFELRVTAMGHHMLAAKLVPPTEADGHIDSRRTLGITTIEPFELPEPVADRCRALLQRLGLVFGCFDLLVTPQGEVVFLEVNPMGQFLWVEQSQPELRVTDAFCELLGQARPDFEPSLRENALRFADIRAQAREMALEAQERHIIPESNPMLKEQRDRSE
ncbi:MAG: hypothetical protein AB1Z98_16910 [Nannocystaceae bacterium]